MKIILKITVLTFIFIVFQQSIKAERLYYKDVLNSAINNSFDLKMSAVDIDISKAQLKAVRADWYPTLSMQFNTEHNNDLSNSNGSYAYAGNTMITPYNQYRNMAYLTLSYNLFDFGIQGKKVNIAKKELEQKKISHEIQLKELKLKILDLYTKVQQYNNEIATKSQIFYVYENMFHNKEKIFEAGISNKISVMDEAIKIAKTQNDIESSKLLLKNSLEDLSYYTSTKYNPNDIDVNFIDEINDENNVLPVSYNDVIQSSLVKQEYNLDFNSANTLESSYYDLEIEKKKSELSILKRQLLPTFKFYTGYSLYGQNPNHYWNSVQNIGQRSLVIGISSNYVFFDGFKNKANREKTTLEIQKLHYEKDKKLAELQKQYEKSFQAYESYNEELIIKKELLKNVKEKLTSVSRLKANRLVEENELLTARAELLSQEFELEQNIININSKIEEMKIMSGVDL